MNISIRKITSEIPRWEDDGDCWKDEGEEGRAEERGEGSRRRGEAKWEERGTENTRQKEKILTGHCSPVGNLQISKVYGFPDKEVAICKVGEGDCPETMG